MSKKLNKTSTPSKVNREPIGRVYVRQLWAPLYSKMRAHPHRTSLIILIVVSFITHFWMFGFPNQAVFDEVYFGKFVGGYFTHSYFFDIHPPLGKLLIAGFASLFGYNATDSFAAIGTAYSGTGYLALRFLPSLAGLLLPLIFYSLCRELKMQTRTALVIGLIVALENAFLVQSRFILIDSFLLTFGFGSLWAYLVWRRRQTWSWLIAAAGLAIAAGSVKWTGLTFFVLPLMIELFSWGYRRWANWQRLARVLATYALVGVALYSLFFAIHLSLLTKTGDGDAFMSVGFQKTLDGSIYTTDATPALGLRDKIIELNSVMYSANASLTASHPYGSKWYSWPLMLRPISYWVDGQGAIWFIGNPIVWWGSSVAVIWLIFELGRGKLSGQRRKAAALILGALALNFLPFAGISRVMFLYHYLPALGFAILAAGLVMDKMNRQKQLAILTAVVLCFLLYAPYTYGTPLTSRAVDLRTWLPTWR